MKLLKTFWKHWMKIAKPIGNFQARVLFTVFYFLILFVIGLPLRFFSDVLLLHKNAFPKKSALLPWEHLEENLEEARRPF